ncbi:MAG: hypothetical protein H6648_02395 [Caldilineae bacterium]|nr:hypothetical protein [Caldilineae bacterium]
MSFRIPWLSKSTWVLVAALGFVIGLGGALQGSSSSSQVQAQGSAEGCLEDCEFSCLNETDDWTGRGTGAGIWMIVHAMPIYKNGVGVDSATHWYDPSPEQYPPMTVTGHWKEKSGTNVETFTVVVDDDGSCDYTDAGDHIRCHKEVVVDSDSDFLCDSYAGVWDREVQASSGVGQNCVDQANMAFDFEQEITIDSVVYCFIKADVYANMPGSTGLRGKIPGSCPGNNAAWDTTRNAAANPVDFTCAEYDETRPDLSNVRLDLDLPYYYR